MKREKRERIVYFLIGLLVFMILMFPLYWMIVTALKTQVEIFEVPTPLWPRDLTLEAFKSQFAESASTMTGFRNSFLISICSMVIATLLAIPAAVVYLYTLTLF